MRQPEDGAPGLLRFRRLVPSDVDRVGENEREGFRHPGSRDLIARELEHAWSTTLIATAAGEEILGFIVFWLVHDELHVLNIATALEARRGGVGRALMIEAHEAARGRGARLATLEVRRSNTPAIELYRSLGYRQVGVRPNYYADEGEDAIVMDLDLV